MKNGALVILVLISLNWLKEKAQRHQGTEAQS